MSDTEPQTNCPGRPDDDVPQYDLPEQQDELVPSSTSPLGSGGDAQPQSVQPHGSGELVPRSPPNQLSPVGQNQNQYITMEKVDAPRFGDTITNTTGPVYNAPVEFHQHNYYTLVEQRQTVQITNEQPNTSTQPPAPVNLQKETSPKSLDETLPTSHQPPTVRNQSNDQLLPLTQPPAPFVAREKTEPTCTDPLTPSTPTPAIDTEPPVNPISRIAETEKCKELKTLLKVRVETVAKEASSLAALTQRRIEPVNLSIVSKPQQLNDEYQAEGHYHRREELGKIYERPESDITGEEMFSRAKMSARTKAEKTFSKKNQQNIQNHTEKHGNVVGVVGQAGIGKTTSAKKWALQALDGQLCGNISFIFYIVIRLIDFSQKMTLLQLLISTVLPEWTCTNDEVKNILSVICNDPNVLLIFDGLDEAAFKTFSRSVPQPLIYSKSKPEYFLKHLSGGNLLPRARKIFTSRPSQLYKLHSSYRPSFIVQILGLTPRSRDELGRQICSKRYHKIRERLIQNNNLLAYCYVPVNCILTLNYLMSNSGGIYNVSMTRILSYTCVKYAQTEHLKGEKCELEKLSKLAWDGFLKKRLVFKINHLEEAGIKTSTADAFLNTSVAMQANLMLTILDGHKYKYFSHLIWQEFFAAVYLMMIMPKNKFQEHCRQLENSRWEVVAKFAFGIADPSVFRELDLVIPGSSVEKLVARISVLENLFIADVFCHKASTIKRVCSWAREANCAKLTSTVSRLLPAKMPKSNYLLIDIENITFVLCADRMQWISTLDLSNNLIGDSGAAAVARCVHNVESLLLANCGIGVKGTEELSEMIKGLPRHLVGKLDLSRNKIRNEGATFLAQCVHKTLELILWGCEIGSKGVNELSSKIRLLVRKQKTLDLSCNQFGNPGAASLAKCINKIERLLLQQCNIQRVGIRMLCSTIKYIEYLDLSGNPDLVNCWQVLESCAKRVDVLDVRDCGLTSKMRNFIKEAGCKNILP